MSSRAAFHYFSDILAATRKARKLAGGMSLAEYKASTTEQLAVERLLQIITEASIHLSDADKDLCHYRDWRSMRNLGNRLRYAYFSVDAHQIWLIVQDDLPLLEQAVEHTLREHFPDVPLS